MWNGKIESAHIAFGHSAPMVEMAELDAVAGKGIKGDRYAEGRGFFSHKEGPQRQVSLFEAEVLDTIARDQNVKLSANECRMNLITRDVPLSHLVDRKFRVGEAVLRGIKINEPCAHLEEIVGKRLLPSLMHRCGLHAEVLESGRIRPADTVTEITEEAPRDETNDTAVAP